MSVVARFYSTTVGKKIVMAGSGIALVGFVVGHMLGNLKAFAGVDAHGMHKLDHYGLSLRSFGEDFLGHGTFLWIVRALLLVCVLLHFFSALQLSRLNQKAKGEVPHEPAYRSANAASLSMLYGGLLLAIFIVYHLLHMTTGQTHFAGFEEGKVYSNVVRGFSGNILIPGFYVIAMGSLCLHLYHGVWSMFQTLGVTAPEWNNGIRLLAKTVAIVTFIGFSAVPLAVVFGVLRLG